jgi:hypothetical protein
MKKNQILLVSLSLIALGGYLLYKQSKEKPEPTKEEEEEPTTDDKVIDFSQKTDFDKILKKGDKNKEVYILQKALKQLNVDGDFGDKTEKRLKMVTGLTQISLKKYNEIIKNK